MTWALIDFDALEVNQLAEWRQVRDADPTLDSPYFHPAFAGAVHATFGDVQVATNGHEAWFPIQVKNRVARPAGWPGADFHGPVAAPGVSIDPLDLVRSTGLRALRFDHVSDDRTEFAPWVDEREESPLIDVTDGLDGYLGRLGKASRDKLSRVRRMTNKAARQLGEVRLVHDVQDPALLDWVISNKRAQYNATGAYDFFAMAGRREFVHRLAETRADTFAGMLSAVYAGETLLAAHFGLRDGGVLHWWFPVFDREYAELAPGWILLRELISAAPALGMTRIDLGPGEEEYKLKAMTGSTVVCQGEVTPDRLRRKLRVTRVAARRVAIARLKNSPLKPKLSAMRAAGYRALSTRDAKR
ncbi:GNAT family N-acetyltransferase [Mycobacterium sp. 21AC1]|uniref:GNAT family N-acetyltransferase n=1 Tax=[Mycobacterium] appelbergii TaxID=2939269 RepID=UPI0029390C45|nr:GNAT family N-acetyltransferase [Mycobacterium sp. 21AC1]MDV3128659.1 GNAT family N-acetyltransferase [Mycobacterium sp. 21AC1]